MRQVHAPLLQQIHAPSRPLLAAERCAYEPASGGLNFDEAVEEWGCFTSEDQAKWENDPDVRRRLLKYADDHAAYVWLTKRFNFYHSGGPSVNSSALRRL